MIKIKLISLFLLTKFAFNILNLSFLTHNKVYLNKQSVSFKLPVKGLPRSRDKPSASPKIIGKGDILISELLFNPRTGGVDFVEIYNRSNHEIDLQELMLANANAAGEPASIKRISTSKMMIAPGTYWVITTNAANIKQHYQAKFSTQFIQLASLPAFNNDKGTVILMSNNEIIDRLNYSAKIHHPLIQDEDGISIERVSFEQDANEPGNFKSAAASVGFATPTYQNSQAFSGAESFAKLASKTFSPDGDAFEDVLTLDYQLAENSGMATVSVFSDKGRLVRKLLKNQTVATKGSIIWDGLNDGGQKAAVGIYVILFEVYNLKGNTQRFKNTCVLAEKLN